MAEVDSKFWLHSTRSPNMSKCQFACYTYRMHFIPIVKMVCSSKCTWVMGQFVQWFTMVTWANDPASAPVYKTLSHRLWQCKLSEAANYHMNITDESNVKYKKSKTTSPFYRYKDNIYKWYQQLPRQNAHVCLPPLGKKEGIYVVPVVFNREK